MTTKLKKQFAVSTDKVFPFTQQEGATSTYSNDYGTFSIVDDIEPLPAYNFAFM